MAGLIKLVEYDPWKHGHVDDCDYVLVAGPGSFELAETMVAKLGYEVQFYEQPNGEREYVCCHA
jgi:hypothetical protein